MYDAFACIAQLHRESLGVIDHCKQRCLNSVEKRSSKPELFEVVEIGRLVQFREAAGSNSTS